MKKLGMITLLAGVLFGSALAEDKAAMEKPRMDERPAVVQDRGEFIKAQKEHRAKMKATEEKMAKLVKDYQQLKGKKKEAKKAELVAEVAAIREEQLKFKQAQLDRFTRRLAEMEKQVTAEKADKEAWVNEKTGKLIEANGDLKVLFERPKQGPQGPRDVTKGKKGGKAFLRKFRIHRKKMSGPQGPQGKPAGNLPPAPAH